MFWREHRMTSVGQYCQPKETHYLHAMNARTKTLFHFTRTLDNLMLILQEGFWSQYSLEDMKEMENGTDSSTLALACVHRTAKQSP